jgi:hypothetical protein
MERSRAVPVDGRAGRPRPQWTGSTRTALPTEESEGSRLDRNSRGSLFWTQAAAAGVLFCASYPTNEGRPMGWERFSKREARQSYFWYYDRTAAVVLFPPATERADRSLAGGGTLVDDVVVFVVVIVGREDGLYVTVQDRSFVRYCYCWSWVRQVDSITAKLIPCLSTTARWMASNTSCRFDQ